MLKLFIQNVQISDTKYSKSGAKVMLFFDICKYFLENINNEQKGAMQKANVLPPYKPADSVQEGEKQESGLAAAPSEKMK